MVEPNLMISTSGTIAMKAWMRLRRQRNNNENANHANTKKENKRKLAQEGHGSRYKADDDICSRISTIPLREKGYQHLM